MKKSRASKIEQSITEKCVIFIEKFSLIPEMFVIALGKEIQIQGYVKTLRNRDNLYGRP